MALEQAQYAVEKRNPPYEIRDYPPAIVAVVRINGERSDAVNAGFRILANYIFGNNQQHAKIAMTAPVTQERERADTGASENNTASSDAWSVRFMMPASYALQSLPAPYNERVHLERTVSRRMAAVTFSGRWSDSNLNSHEVELRQWMKQHNLTEAATAVYAYYDPPWTPWFMRRIEVLIEFKKNL